MTVWTWVLIVLGVAGFVMAAAAVVPVFRLALHVRGRVDELQNSPFASSVRGLPYQGQRIAASTGRLEELASRAETAVGSIRESAETLRLQEAKNALTAAGEEITALIAALR